MDLKYIIAICMAFLLVGCASKTTPAAPVETPPEPAAVETPPVPVETPETAPVETATEPSEGGSVSITAAGFDKEEIKVTKGSYLMITNDDLVLHKLNGGDLFRSQFNTHLKSLYGKNDALGRNQVGVTFADAGVFEIKDVSKNKALKVTVE